MEKNIVSFDLTGTIATYKFSDSVWFEGLPRRYAEKHDIPFQLAEELVRREYDKLGEEAVEWYDIKHWFNWFGFGSGWTELLQEFTPNIEFYPEAVEVLERCSRMYDLVLITNASREFVEIEIASINSYFHTIISCVSDFGEVKKTPQFYSKVCGFLGRGPYSWVHVGDHYKFDFLAPRECGMAAFYLDRIGEHDGEFIIHSLDELEELLVQVH